MTQPAPAPVRLVPPPTDPSPIFEAFRGAQATELLTAAVAHLGVFDTLRAGPLDFASLRARMGLERRPANVLLTALRAMGLVAGGPDGRFSLTELARNHLLPGGAYYVGDYVGLAAKSPGVLEMVERLRTNRPAGAKPQESGAAFIFREGIESAMEREADARRLTLALAGRARNVAPVLAERFPLNGRRVLLDAGGGTGLYAIAYLQRQPGLRAIVWDRPEVLKVAGEMAAACGVADRLELAPGDMFADPVPAGADAALLSNVLHDWDEPECLRLVRRLSDALPAGGSVLVHDVFLSDSLDGPLPVALYSASLFALTEGRAYSAAEYRAWLTACGLRPGPVVPTLVHCGVLAGVKG
jgi:hypothetical protein